jgi:hypothetical protein
MLRRLKARKSSIWDRFSKRNERIQRLFSIFFGSSSGVFEACGFRHSTAKLHRFLPRTTSTKSIRDTNLIFNKKPLDIRNIAVKSPIV